MAKPLPSDALLDQLTARPERGAELIGGLSRYSNQRELLDALKVDPRFRAPLHAALANVEAVNAHAPWLVQLVRADLGAMPALIALWRSRGRAAQQAGQQLLALGEPDALEALAADAGEVVGLAAKLAFEAIFALHPARAWERTQEALARSAKSTATLLWLLATRPERVAADARWARFASDALGSADRFVAEAARALVAAGALPAAERERLLAEVGPAVRDAPPDAAHDAALTAARARMDALVVKLPDGAWTRAGGHALAALAALEQLVGRLPAAVRAFYERVDRLDTGEARPADRLLVFGLDRALTDARAWSAAHAPRATARLLVPPFLFPVSPDGYTRAGLSGGPPWGFELPTDDEDPVVAGAPRKPRFSAYVARAARRKA